MLLLLIGGGRLRAHKHNHTAALQLGGLFHVAYIGTGFGKALHDAVSQLGVCHFTAAEADRNLDTVAGSQELLGLVDLGIKIVGINVQGTLRRPSKLSFPLSVLQFKISTSAE